MAQVGGYSSILSFLICRKKSDPFDDFARELMEFRRDQKRRQVEQSYSLSPSRSVLVLSLYLSCFQLLYFWKKKK